MSSAAQRVLVGGAHFMIADVWLEDSMGKELTVRHLLTIAVPGGGGIGGVIADQIVNQIIKEPIYRLADGLGLQARNWLAPPAGAPNPVKSRGAGGS